MNSILLAPSHINLLKAHFLNQKEEDSYDQTKWRNEVITPKMGRGEKESI